MAQQDELRAELESLHQKVDRVLALLGSMETGKAAASTRRSPKPKSAPLTQEDIDALKRKFKDLYERWLSGHEIEVQEELEQLDVEGLRRLGDANDLNVSSKMPKQRILYLIGARFREKKQLHKGSDSRERQVS